jgi:Zn finger protein HypA/HybF involved in hydrogenase expression
MELDIKEGEIMVRCRNCGKEVEEVDEDGLCEECSDEWSDEEMDDFATMIINSPFNPGLN